jgi:KDO2-lipid IV(A) lauroyltransferase
VNHLVGYLAYRVFSAVFGALPEPVVRRCGEALGRLAYHIAPKRRALVQSHMARVLGADADTKRAAKRMFIQYGRYWAEVFWVTPRRKREIVEHCTVTNLDLIDAALAEGKGAIFALPHVGNWEAAGAKAEAIDMQVLAVAEALPNPRIVDWFLDVRNQLGIDIIVARRGARVTPALIERLAEGRIVALLTDRDIKGKGIEVEFFGERTTMPAGSAALAERTGAALFPVGAFFRKGRGHAMQVFPPIAPSQAATQQERVAEMTQALATAFEEVIRTAPDQWHLFQPNWPSDRERSTS